MVTPAQSVARAHDQRGFSLIELMLVALISSAVLGSAVMLASQVQGVYTHELSDAAVQQEARYALDWMGRTLAPAGSNPYGITTSACPAAGTAFAALRLDPDGDGVHDDVRIQADVNPPNGVLLGLAGACTEQGEDLTIAHDPAALTLTQRDMAVAGGAVPVTDGIFTQLRFTYLTANRTVTTTPGTIAYVRIDLTARSRARDVYTGQFNTFSYQSEVRIRAR